MRLRYNFYLLFFTVCLKGAEPVDSEPFNIVYNLENKLVTITFKTANGRLLWKDILCGIAQVKGYDGDSLKEIIPGNRAITIDSFTSRLFFSGLNLSLSPHILFELEPGKAGLSSRLKVTLDKKALFESKRRIKRRLRKAFLSLFKTVEKSHFGIEFDQDLGKTAEKKKLVLFIHGLNSKPERVAEIQKYVKTLNFSTAVFSYPNDQPIKDSAQLLSKELLKIKKIRPGQMIAIVSFSMGGLVARSVVEDPALDPGNVKQLIMVSPPTHGSTLAHFAFATEWFEHLKDWKKKSALELFYSAVEDGLGEAEVDLEPGSQFLKKLNDRERNPRIKYTVFLGTGAPLSEQSLVMIENRFKELGERNLVVRFFGKKLDGYLKDMDEVIMGKGDGAVSVKRGKLDGVADTMILNYNHVEMANESGGAESARLRDEIIKRLKKDY